MRRFFTFDLRGGGELAEIAQRKSGVPLKALCLGRRHPLKGTDVLRAAVQDLDGLAAKGNFGNLVELREVSDHFDAEPEADWAWTDVLCLPTLSENFGLVVAEALARGKPAITTDGAPAWEGQEGVVYLKGYRDGDFATRVKQLREALCGMLGQRK